MPSAQFRTSLDRALYDRATAKAANESKPLESIVHELIQKWVGDFQPTLPQPVPGTQTYIVKSGDSLWKIAEQFYGDGTKYALIAEANHISNARRIESGMSLIIPPWIPPPVIGDKGPIPNAGVSPQPGYPIEPDGLDQLRQVFGDFHFTELTGSPAGRIKIDPAWAADNIVTTPIPTLGIIQCHKLVAPVLINVFKTLEEAGLAASLKYYGCFLPRHKNWNPAKDISVHSWGVAIDLNADTNAFGTEGNMDPQVVRVFADHGFYWGGNFGDPMHFQYCLGY